MPGIFGAQQAAVQSDPIDRLIQSLRAPETKVTSFSGADSDDYLQFKTSFARLYHKPDNDMQYLFSQLMLALKGEAKAGIQHLTNSPNAYQQAWTLLEQRYNNRSVVLMKVEARFSTLKAVKSLRDAEALRDAYNHIMSLYYTYVNHGVQQGGSSLIQRFLARLPWEFRKEWMKSVARNQADGESVEQFLHQLGEAVELSESLSLVDKVIGKEAEKQEAKEDKQSSGDKKNSGNKSKMPAVAAFAADAQQQANGGGQQQQPKIDPNKCLCCQKGQHALQNCNKFKDLSVRSRFELCKKRKICIGCFQTGHIAKKCQSSGKCDSCGKKHHQLLCKGKSAAANVAIQGGAEEQK